MGTNPAEIEIQKRLTEQIALVVSVKPGAVKPDAALHELGMDSMGFVEMLVFIEKQFGLKLIETGLKREDFQTVQSLAKRIHDELRS